MKFLLTLDQGEDEMNFTYNDAVVDQGIEVLLTDIEHCDDGAITVNNIAYVADVFFDDERDICDLNAIATITEEHVSIHFVDVELFPKKRVLSQIFATLIQYARENY